jgi:hypothetical protein
MFMTEAQLRREHEFIANTIQDRKRWILESAKNLLYDPDDTEQLEYKKFEEIANQMLRYQAIAVSEFLFRGAYAPRCYNERKRHHQPIM